MSKFGEISFRLGWNLKTMWEEFVAIKILWSLNFAPISHKTQVYTPLAKECIMP